MNVMTLVPAINHQFMGDARNYLDIYIDGVPLRQKFAGRQGALPDNISPLGWAVSGAEEHTLKQFQRFLLMSPPDLADDRNSILICPLDGDLGCGAFSARFDRIDSTMRWSVFGYENNYDPESVNLERYKNIAPLIFYWAQYEKELLSHYNNLLKN